MIYMSKGFWIVNFLKMVQLHCRKQRRKVRSIKKPSLILYVKPLSSIILFMFLALRTWEILSLSSLGSNLNPLAGIQISIHYSNFSLYLLIFDNKWLYVWYFRFFLGSNKVMQVALGRSDSDEIRSGLHKVSKVQLTILNVWRFCSISLNVPLFDLRFPFSLYVQLLRGESGLCVTNMPKEETQRLLQTSVFDSLTSAAWLLSWIWIKTDFLSSL